MVNSFKFIPDNNHNHRAGFGSWILLIGSIVLLILVAIAPPEFVGCDNSKKKSNDEQASRAETDSPTDGNSANPITNRPGDRRDEVAFDKTTPKQHQRHENVSATSTKERHEQRIGIVNNDHTTMTNEAIIPQSKQTNNTNNDKSSKPSKDVKVEREEEEQDQIKKVATGNNETCENVIDLEEATGLFEFAGNRWWSVPGWPFAIDEILSTLRGLRASASSHSSSSTSRSSASWTKSVSSEETKQAKTTTNTKTSRKTSTTSRTITTKTTPINSQTSSRTRVKEPCAGPPPLPSLWIRIIFFIMYAIIFAVGFLGNILTLWVMYKKRGPLPITDIFIGNLALSDIWLCVFGVSVVPISTLWKGYWSLGYGPCLLFSFTVSLTVYISTFTMICIAYHRYELIVNHHKLAMSRERAYLICALTWVTGSIITIPYLIHVRLLPPDCDITYCDENWDPLFTRFGFSLISLLAQFFVPLISSSYFYGRIFLQLKRNERNRPSRAARERELMLIGAFSIEPGRKQRQLNNQMIRSLLFGAHRHANNGINTNKILENPLMLPGPINNSGSPVESEFISRAAQPNLVQQKEQQQVPKTQAPHPTKIHRAETHQKRKRPRSWSRSGSRSRGSKLMKQSPEPSDLVPIAPAKPLDSSSMNEEKNGPKKLARLDTRVRHESCHQLESISYRIPGGAETTSAPSDRNSFCPAREMERAASDVGCVRLILSPGSRQRVELINNILVADRFQQQQQHENMILASQEALKDEDHGVHGDTNLHDIEHQLDQSRHYESPTSMLASVESGCFDALSLAPGLNGLESDVDLDAARGQQQAGRVGPVSPARYHPATVAFNSRCRASTGEATGLGVGASSLSSSTNKSPARTGTLDSRAKATRQAAIFPLKRARSDLATTRPSLLQQEQFDLIANCAISASSANQLSRQQQHHQSRLLIASRPGSQLSQMINCPFPGNEFESKRNRRTRQTNLKLLAILGLFVFCWLPLNVYNTATDLLNGDADYDWQKITYIICQLCACLSVCLNPILYYWMSENYKQDLINTGIIPKRWVKQNNNKLNNNLNLYCA